MRLSPHRFGACAVFLTAAATHAQQLPGPGTRRGFGFSVAMDGDTLVVGAPYEPGVQGSNVGAAYVYQRTGGQWQQTARLTSIEPGLNDTFGLSVAIQGNLIAVGVPTEAIPAGGTGSIEFFVNTGTAWQWANRYKPGVPSQGFGDVIAMYGNRLAVGRIADPGPTGTLGTGRVLLYEVNGTSLTNPVSIYAPDGAANDAFGRSLGLDGSRLIAGAPYHDTGGRSDAGAAYVFNYSSFNPTFETRLTAADGAAGDQFGTSVAIKGDYAIAGAPRQSQGTAWDGAAYFFSRSPAWQMDAKFTVPSDAPFHTGFGNAVAMSANHAVVATGFARALGGRVLRYERVGRTWFHRATHGTESDGDNSRPAIALQDTELLAGYVHFINSGTVDEAGAAFTYPIPQPSAGADLQLYTGDPTSLRPAPHGTVHTPGQAWLEHSQSWPITVHNAGAAPLQITSATLLPGASPGVTVDPLGFGGIGSLWIEPGATGILTVHTYFETAGPHTATLSLNSNDPAPSPYNLPLTFTAQLKTAPAGLRISREGNQVVLRYPQQPGIFSYQAQRSTSLGNWQSIGTLSPEFDPESQTSPYTFRDYNPLPGTSFYRVKIQ